MQNGKDLMILLILGHIIFKKNNLTNNCKIDMI